MVRALQSQGTCRRPFGSITTSLYDYPHPWRVAANVHAKRHVVLLRLTLKKHHHSRSSQLSPSRLGQPVFAFLPTNHPLRSKRVNSCEHKRVNLGERPRRDRGSKRKTPLRGPEKHFSFSHLAQEKLSFGEELACSARGRSP